MIRTRQGVPVKLRNLRVLPVCLLLCAGSVRAGDLYKCEDAKGAVTIGSDKCPPGSKQVWKRDAAPDAPLTPEEEARAAARRAQDRENARALSLMAGTTPVPAAPAAAPAPAAPTSAAPAATPVVEGPCRKAHALASGIRANPWLEMRDDQMRRLDAWVAAQCADPED